MQKNHLPIIYTLGPEGTNCAKAAAWWLQRQDIDAKSSASPSNVLLYKTLELAFDALINNRDGYLLSCAAYPDLHTLIFTRLQDMELCNSFILPTHSMVLAARIDANNIKKLPCILHRNHWCHLDMKKSLLTAMQMPLHCAIKAVQTHA